MMAGAGTGSAPSPPQLEISFLIQLAIRIESIDFGSRLFNFKESFQPQRDSRPIRRLSRTSVVRQLSAASTQAHFSYDDWIFVTRWCQPGRSSWVQKIARKKSGRQTLF